MSFSTKSFLMGLGAGAAVALLFLDLWGRHYTNEYFFRLAASPASPFSSARYGRRREFTSFCASAGALVARSQQRSARRLAVEEPCRKAHRAR